ncbi:hypothetical protein [Paramicrobacterium chengjingii]|uniref:Uncharacterized protein n=1 Tax=Paramicrobacterium chengjingii TaxID=2769067 RepID=A0ABX6YLN2_9MICO|nr:hypothetical protein [Microbacterium chengjingii]QPZ39718.1 hypothetical protein HCR76_06645 [Microbacterium chengjingii]
MSAHEVTFYQVKCDCCGVVEDDYGDFAAMADFGQAQASAESVGWARVDGEDLCNGCWCWPEDLSDYPGDDAWTATDDPLRKHAQHPVSDHETEGKA